MSPYEQYPAVFPSSGAWPRLVVPMIAAAIVLALGLLFVTLTSSGASDQPPGPPPTAQTISR